MRRAAAAALGATLLAIAAACGGSAGAPATGAGEVAELRSVDQVASAFEADRGQPRLVLLLSPT